MYYMIYLLIFIEQNKQYVLRRSDLSWMSNYLAQGIGVKIYF